MLYFPRELFELQVNFAYRMAEVYGLSFEESLLKFTSTYTRLIGFSDTAPPSMDNKVWRKMIKSLPKDKQGQVDSIYGEYIKYEKEKSKVKPTGNVQVRFGCFSYFYKEEKNTFALHFINADSKGNLSRNRIEKRKKELKSLIQSIKEENKKNALVYMTSWLLSIEAMTRLLPPKFIATVKPRNNGLAQDNGSWGQFVDKNGFFKHNMAKKLLKNMEQKKHQADEYFPLRMLRAEAKQEVLFDFYLKS